MVLMNNMLLQPISICRNIFTKILLLSYIPSSCEGRMAQMLASFDTSGVGCSSL